jgi:hypothetical protein
VLHSLTATYLQKLIVVALLLSAVQSQSTLYSSSYYAKVTAAAARCVKQCCTQRVLAAEVAVAQLPRASVPCDNWHLTRVLLLLLFVLLLAMKWYCTQANIITDLLDFAELKGGSTALRATEFDIDEAVRSAVRMFTTTVRSKVLLVACTARLLILQSSSIQLSKQTYTC